jgi:hypothetical protein
MYTLGALEVLVHDRTDPAVLVQAAAMPPVARKPGFLLRILIAFLKAWDRSWVPWYKWPLWTLAPLVYLVLRRERARAVLVASRAPPHRPGPLDLAQVCGPGPAAPAHCHND